MFADDDTTISPIIPLPPCSCLPCVISVDDKISSLDITVVLLVYTYKLVYSNSDISKGAIKEQLQYKPDNYLG